MVINVEVTEQDIKTGERSSCTRCPIALAIRHKGYYNALVGSIYVHIGLDRYLLPPEAQVFIRTFDEPCNTEIIKPFKFKLIYKGD